MRSARCRLGSVQRTRAGIERAELSDRANVVYHELDFIPGYEFVGGHFDGQVWGVSGS
jgi:hypothetical protein